VSRAAFILIVCLTAAGCADPTTTTAPTTAALSGIALSSTSVLGGTAVTATITLTASAPAGGAAIALTSSGAAVTVPSTVTVPEGSNSLSFPVATAAAAASTTITATYAGTSQTATLATTVVVVAAVQGFSLSNSVSMAGVPVQATVTLSAPAPAAGFIVALTSSTPAATLPSSILIPIGQTTVTFTIDVKGSTSAAATFTASGGGVTRTASLTIGQLAFALAPGSVAGGLPDAGMVSIPVPAPDGGAVIALASSSSKAMVPATVTIPSGATSQTFTIATIDAPPTESATIVASYGGSSQSATITIVAYPVVAAVTCSPATVSGGATIQCSGTLGAPGAASGWRLALASSDASVTPPPRLTTTPGSSTFQFSLTTSAVSSPTSVTVSIYDADSGFSLWTLGISVTP
jgi:hypothetical protein